ncbi:MAG: hypothetical protein ACLRWQ_06360 [Flavonifractor plautii]
MDQGYFAVRPAIRIRREAVLGGETRYVLCFKGGAGLAREEVEVDVDEGRYLRLMAMLSGPMIEKEQRRYLSPGGLTLEVNQVDPALESGFTTPRWSLTPRPPPWPDAAGGTDGLPLPRGHWPARREHGGLLGQHPRLKSPAGMACGGVSLSKKPFRQAAELFETSKKFQKVV